MNLLQNAFSDAWFTATNMTAEVNEVPWTDYKLGQYIPRTEKKSVTATISIGYRNEKQALIPAQPRNNTDGINFTATKGKVVKLDVAGYPATADINADEIRDYIRPGVNGVNVVGLQRYTQERWNTMLPSVKATREFIFQGMLENKIMTVDEAGNLEVLEDLTAIKAGWAPQVAEIDWTNENAPMTDFIAEQKLAAEQELGGDVGPVEDWALFLVGGAGAAFRRNKAINKEKFLDDFSWQATDKIRKVQTICSDVRMLTYTGAKIGGKTALDLDVVANVERGTAYLVPLVKDLFDEVYVPAPTFSTLGQEAVPLYSWLAPGDDPMVSVKLKLWMGMIAYCKKPRAIRKIQLPHA